jgi:hypothetical protein
MDIGCERRNLSVRPSRVEPCPHRPGIDILTCRLYIHAPGRISRRGASASISGDIPMRKLTLDLDSLDVQSFDPQPRLETDRGTVHGHESHDRPCTPMCPSMYDEATTCHVSDLGTCVVSCGSCGYTCAVGGYTCVTCDMACWETS